MGCVTPAIAKFSGIQVKDRRDDLQVGGDEVFGTTNGPSPRLTMF